MKNYLTLVLTVILSNFTAHADGITEGFETGLQDPFNGSSELIWTGDLADYQITTASWPYGSGVDFLGDYSIRAKENGELNATILTSISGVYISSVKTRWEVYVSGNNATITTSKGFSLILFVDSDEINNIESGTINGYRLRLADPDGSDPDGLYLEKASGAGWIKIDQLVTGDANINQGWNLAIERNIDGTWNWGFSNGSPGTAVTLTKTVLDNEHISGSWAGMNWYSTSSDAADFGFDTFKVDAFINGLWKTDALTTSWSTSTNWDDGLVPGDTTNVVIPANATVFPVVNSSNATCMDITLKPGARLTLEAAGVLDVNGGFKIESDSLSSGSFLDDGTLILNTKNTAIFERYIEAYTGNEDGWHLISSPVGQFTVSGSDFEPGNNDDLYKWEESSNLWKNYKATGFNLESGNGYLVAYEQSETRLFEGEFQKSNITFNNLGNSSGNGWHLLGNPFPCAIVWNDGNWALTNIETTAQVYNEEAGNYFSVTSGNVIPATQGFFIKVTDNTNSITIPEESRAHDETQFYCPNGYPEIVLDINCLDNQFFDRTTLRFIQGATEYYDKEYDGHKLSGQLSAPQLYTISSDGHELSVYTSGQYYDQTVQLGFDAGISGNYKLAVNTLNGFHENTSVVLEDIVEDTMIHIDSDSATYNFYAGPSGPSGRFKVHFNCATQLKETRRQETVVFYRNGHLYVIPAKSENRYVPLLIYDMTGRRVFNRTICLNSATRIPLNLKSSLYLVCINGINHENIIVTVK